MGGLNRMRQASRLLFLIRQDLPPHDLIHGAVSSLIEDQQGQDTHRQISGERSNRPMTWPFVFPAGVVGSDSGRFDHDATGESSDRFSHSMAVQRREHCQRHERDPGTQQRDHQSQQHREGQDVCRVLNRAGTRLVPLSRLGLRKGLWRDRMEQRPAWSRDPILNLRRSQCIESLDWMPCGKLG